MLGFVSSIRNSKKVALRNLLKVLEHDSRSVTGRNLRRLLLQSDENDVRNLTPNHGIHEFRATPENEKYRVEFIINLMELRENIYSTDISNNEIENNLAFLCIT